MLSDFSTEARQQCLSEKLQANGQRNSRRQLLASLKDELRSELEACPFLVTPEADFLCEFFILLPDGVGRTRHQRPGYTYREFGWEEKVLRAARSVGPKHDETLAYFGFGMPPLYEVRLGWVRRNLDELWERSTENLGVLAQDLSAGIVISNYVGYLQGDINPDEVVYELGIWGF